MRAGAREQEGSSARVPQAHDGGAGAVEGEAAGRGLEGRAEAALIGNLRRQVLLSRLGFRV